MLTEVLDAAAQTRRSGRRRPNITISSFFPCPYRLRLVHEGRFWDDEITPQVYYNMDDGHWQEEQSVRRLRKAGIIINDRQRSVSIGKSNVTGHMDGTFEVNGTRHVWEHKAYDTNAQAMWVLRTRGFDALPSQKAQINGYMLGAELTSGVFFIKLKNNNEYVDVSVSLDRPFVEEIVEWCDRIRIDDWKPEPKECQWCTSCGHGCFDELLDMSWIQSADSLEAVEKWKKGKQLKDVGGMLMEEADAVLIGIRGKDGKFIQRGLIGDKDLLELPGLRITRSVSHRSTVSREKILDEFGADALVRMMDEKKIVSYRHKET